MSSVGSRLLRVRYWLAVVHRDHVRRGVEQGIAQVNHGSRAGIQRMSPGDGLVYYSPKDAYPEGSLLRAFTTSAARSSALASWCRVTGRWRSSPTRQ